MWKELRVAHEGTIAIKTSKINISFVEYESFHYLHDESIDCFLNIFINICNNLVSLGKEIPRGEREREYKDCVSLTKFLVCCHEIHQNAPYI